MQRVKDIISMVPVGGMESQNFDSKRQGWPWTVDPTNKGASEYSGDHDCKISIVTTSLNQGQFIEETIRSVLLQNYPNIAYIIIDGGSTDKTPDIIRKYGGWLAYWISEPDQGQSHALNKGFAQATGDIFAFINSDDYYAPGAFQKMANISIRCRNHNCLPAVARCFKPDVRKGKSIPGGRRISHIF